MLGPLISLMPDSQIHNAPGNYEISLSWRPEEQWLMRLSGGPLQT